MIQLSNLINKIQGAIVAGIGVMLALVSFTASAVPTLQLDIVGGSYDSGTQTIITYADTFSLVAYGKDVSLYPENYYISMSILQDDEPFEVATDRTGFGSFDFAGTIYDIDGLAHGTPPQPTVANNDDLQNHSVFPTFFAQYAFNFVSNQKSVSVNTQDDYGTTPTSGCSLDCLYYQSFLVDVSNMASGLDLHFDLYHLDANGEVDGFAPFSHDAAYVPEPATLVLLGLGLFGLGFSRRKLG